MYARACLVMFYLVAWCFLSRLVVGVKIPFKVFANIAGYSLVGGRYFRSLAIGIFINQALLLVIWKPLLHAQSSFAARHSEFNVSERMRPRVNFWIDVFAKYDRNQIVVHHRDYPGAIFQVLDFSRQARELTPVQLARYRDRILKQEIATLKGIFSRFAGGAQPRNEIERRIYQAMKGVPGGQRKFRAVVEQDLIRGQTGIRCKFEEAIKRSGRYLPLVEQIFVNEYNLPVELTRLPFVESSFDYTAYSKTGAAGIWQFMPATARSFMKVGSVIDERRDPIIATRAAAKYLYAGYRRFNSWPLAVTAYNHGAAGVARKVRTIGTSDIVQIVEHPTQRVLGFASNNFWAELLAAIEVYEQRDKYFPNIRPEPVLRYVEIKLRSSISAQMLSKRLGVDLETLQRYNYGPTPPVWRGRYNLPAGFGLRLPVQYSVRAKELGAATQVTKVQPAAAGSVIYGGAQYRVRKGDTLIGIARRHGITVAQLRSLNGLKSDIIRVGQSLTISRQREGTGVVASGPGTHRVAAGETLSAIARRYGVSIGQIKTQNRLKSDVIRVGQRLVVGGQYRGSSGSGSSSIVHRVGPGETLSAIARRYGVSIAQIKSQNKLKSDIIRVGQKLVVSGRSNVVGGQQASGSSNKQHRVKTGDNLWKIAKRYGTSTSAIKRKNGIGSDNIRPGQLLQIP